MSNDAAEMQEDLKAVFNAFKEIRKVLKKWNIGLEDALLVFRLGGYNGKWLSFRYAPIIMKRLMAIKEKFNLSATQKKNLFDALEISNPRTPVRPAVATKDTPVVTSTRQKISATISAILNERS